MSFITKEEFENTIVQHLGHATTDDWVNHAWLQYNIMTRLGNDLQQLEVSLARKTFELEKTRMELEQKKIELEKSKANSRKNNDYTNRLKDVHEKTKREFGIYQIYFTKINDKIPEARNLVKEAKKAASKLRLSYYH